MAYGANEACPGPILDSSDGAREDHVIRILHVAPSFYPAVRYGGPIESTLGLTRALSALGHDVRVVTTDADGACEVVDCEQAAAADSPDGPEIRRCHRNLPPDISADLVREVAEGVGWADVVHVTAAYSFPTLPALGAAKAGRKPCVWSPRGSFQTDGRQATRLLKSVWRAGTRFLLPRRCVLHVTSQSEAAQTTFRYPNLPFVIVPNGVDVPPASRATARKDGLDVLFLGRIDRIKRVDTLIAAVAEARSKGLKIRLSVAGEGQAELVGALRRLAADLGVSDAVRWHGHVQGEERERQFAEADLLALVSDSENFGMVVAEALARAVPVVAGCGTPWSELTIRGCGFWVESRPETIAEAFEAAIQADLKGMGERGRAWMKEEFSWSGRAMEMVRLYESLLDVTASGSTLEAAEGRT